MKSTVLWTLIVLNIVLLSSFLARVLPGNTAMAQPAPAAAGDYLMMPAEVAGLSTGILVVIDQNRGLLSAINYDDAGNRLDPMQTAIDLRQLFQANMPPARAPAARRGTR